MKVRMLPFDSLDTIIEVSNQKRTKIDPYGQAEDNVDFWKNYNFMKELGRGGQAVVYGAMDRSTGEKLAVKRFLIREDPSVLSDLQNEVNILIDLSRKCPQLVKYYGQTRISEPWSQEVGLAPAILMEWVPGIPMQDQIELHQFPSTLDWQIAFLDLVDQLACVHRADIVHRDIKPNNIVLKSNRGAKLIDFGIGCLTPSSETNDENVPVISACDNTFIGTPAYSAPELQLLKRSGRMTVVRENVPNFSSDVWALGACFYTWITGKMANISALPEVNVDNIKAITADKQIPAVIRKMLDVNPINRPDLRFQKIQMQFF